MPDLVKSAAVYAPIDINPACPRVICPKQPTVIFKLAAKITFIKINIIIPI